MLYRRIAGALVVALAAASFMGCDERIITTVAVEQIHIMAPRTAVNVHETLDLSAIVRDDRGNDLVGRSIGWASSNAAVASVSPQGTVSGQLEGTATITASSEGASASVQITVRPPRVAEVEVTPNRDTVSLGGTLQLVATPRDVRGNALLDRSTSWTSLDPTVASVDANGWIEGYDLGEVIIRATSEGVAGTATVTVRDSVAAVVVSADSGSIYIDEELQLTGTVTGAAGDTLTGRDIYWTTSDPAVAVVDDAGLVSGVGEGAATITATSEGKAGSLAITVGVMPVASVSVSPETATTAPGGTVQLSAAVMGANGAPLEGWTVLWSSSDTTVAGVSPTGLVTTRAVGSVTITATADTASGSAVITVVLMAPLVTSNAAEEITSHSGTLLGHVDDNGSGPYEVWFEWSTDSNFSTYKQSGKAASSTSGSWVFTVWDLYGSTTYYYRIVAENSLGLSRGDIISFTTQPPQSPDIQTDSATDITATSVRFWGSGGANGADTEMWIEWGTDSNLSTYSATSPLTLSVPNYSSFYFWQSINNLQPGTTYYFRAVARNHQGTSRGQILTFGTPSASLRLSAESQTDPASGATASAGAHPLAPWERD